MANFAFNIAKGRAVEFFWRVKNNDGANSAIIVQPLLAAIAAATDGSPEAQDVADLATLLGRYAVVGSSWGGVAGAYGRKALTDTELAAVTPDNTNNRFAATIPQITWTAPTNNAGGLLICYDSDTTSGTDANIIPLCHNDFAVTADGNDIILNPGDCLRVS